MRLSPRLPNRRAALYDPPDKGVAKDAGPEGGVARQPKSRVGGRLRVNLAGLNARLARSATHLENN